MGDISIGQEESLFTFDQMLRQRALDEDQTPLFASPKSQYGVTDYEFINGKELNRFVDGGVKAFIKIGLSPVYEDTVIGVYGATDLNYLVTVFALGRLGYTSFLISPRLPASAVANLLETTNARIMIHSDQHQTIAAVASTLVVGGLTTHLILSRASYDILQTSIGPPFSRSNIDNTKEQHRCYIMLHSSGTTGLPKPLAYTNARLLSTLKSAVGLTSFQSGPFSHAYGLISFSQAIWTRKTLYMFNCNVPQTHDTLTAAILAAKPQIVWAVPFVLKLLAEKNDGIEALKQCRMVCSSGSRCPDELGDKLTNAGVFLGVIFGSTEVSQIFESLSRPRDNKAWNYLLPSPHALPYLFMKPVGDGVHECVVLDGLPTKAVSNSDTPPNSYHTNDLFVPHSTISNAWKFVGRADDRVTLINGEKVLPLPIEGRIVQNGLVNEAVIFGNDQSIPGLLLFRSESANELNDEEFLDQVWPTIDNANRYSEAFSQISREMIIVAPRDASYPVTDKASIKRAQVYREFEHEITKVYNRLEGNENKGTLRMNILELEEWIISTFQDLGITIPNTTADFFDVGVDSLKAIEMRGLITKSLDLSKSARKLPSMTVYDFGNTKRLAKALHTLQMDGKYKEEKPLELMAEMIEKYSILPNRIPNHTKMPEKSHVILTGGTGSLGGQILKQLLAVPQVDKVYCFVRTTPSGQSAAARLASALESQFHTGLMDSDKIIVLSADLTKHDFSLSSADFLTLKTNTTHIIHCAWPVNFVLPLSSFESQLLSIQNLLSFSLSVDLPHPAHLLFCSSIGAAMGTKPPAIIPNTQLELSQASPTGYARSKLVAEHMLQTAVQNHGARAKVLRIGQIVPSRSPGSNKLWNPNEAIPLIVRSAISLGALPASLGRSDCCTWLEVDILAMAVVDISGCGDRGDLDNSSKPQVVYNLVNPQSFSWANQFLPALKVAGLIFETLPYETWLKRLSQSNSDAAINPSRKLLEIWEQNQVVGDTMGEVAFDTRPAQEASHDLATAKMIIEGELVKDFVTAWRKVW